MGQPLSLSETTHLGYPADGRCSDRRMGFTARILDRQWAFIEDPGQSPGWGLGRKITPLHVPRYPPTRPSPSAVKGRVFGVPHFYAPAPLIGVYIFYKDVTMAGKEYPPMAVHRPPPATIGQSETRNGSHPHRRRRRTRGNPAFRKWTKVHANGLSST